MKGVERLSQIRTAWIGGAALLLAGALIPAWPWIALAYHASSYPLTAPGQAANIVMVDSTVFVSLAERGFEIFDAASGRTHGMVPPPSGSGSVDDLAVADNFLFALDARPPGYLSVFSLEDPGMPRLVSPPVAVAVGPFSGVSAGGGRVIVSGGTSNLSLRSYDVTGNLGPVLATTDFGRGQPDVLLDPAGRRAFVSTHLWGPYFALTTTWVSESPPFLVKAGGVDLDTYGFTPGGAKPASFPLEVALDGDILLAANVSGLTIISVADFDQPRILANLALPVKAVNVDVRDHLAAVVGSSPKPLLVFVDVAIPSSPRILRSISLPHRSHATGVALGRTHVAVAAGDASALIFTR